MALKEVLQKLPSLGKSMLSFVLRPSRFVTESGQQEQTSSNWETLVWALAYSILLFGLYAGISGRSIVEAVLASGPVPIATSARSDKPAPKPVFEHLGWQLGGGFRVAFPDLATKGLDTPQQVVFQLGAGWMSVQNVVPSKMGTKVCELLILNVLIYFVALCLFPGFKLLRSRISFKSVLSLSNFYLSSIWVFASSLMLLAVLAFVHLLRLHGWPFYFAYVLLVVLPMGILAIRAFWVGFRRLSDLSVGKFLLSIVMAWIMSWLVMPCSSVLIFGILRLQPILDALL